MRLYFTILAALVLSCGCAHTRIAAREIPAEAMRLASMSRRSVSFNVACPVDEIVGHQYLLIVLPFGRISIQNPQEHLSNMLAVELAKSGYMSRLESPEQATLLVRCNQISLSAYDYIFFRQIVGKVGYSISIRDASGIHPVASSHLVRRSALKAFAFHAQLEYLWHQVVVEAAREISAISASTLT